MSKQADITDPMRLTETMTRPTRESVLTSAYRLGGLIGVTGKSDTESREMCVHVGRLVAECSDVPGRVGKVTIPLLPVEGPLEEIYALMQETIHARDRQTLEQQLNALAVHLGAIIASGYSTDAGRGEALRRAKGRLNRACLVTSRFLNKEPS